MSPFSAGAVSRGANASFDTLGAKPTNVKGAYVVVWKRVGGAWKLWTDIFH